MASQVVESLVAGGKCSAGPPLGPALGPMGVNIGQVVAAINEKTKEFNGMQVPIKVIINSETKQFEIEIGTPPASALIKKEAGVDKGAGNPLTDKVADLKIEQIIKISMMKKDVLLGKDNFARVKEIIGTCDSMGIMVEGKQGRVTIADINAGNFKEKIEQGKTELTAEELKVLAEEKQKLQEELKKRRSELEVTAKSILKEMEGKEKSEIKAKMHEAQIPEEIIKELMPAEEVPGEGKPEAKPAEKK